jgi:hypothetical protein
VRYVRGFREETSTGLRSLQAANRRPETGVCATSLAILKKSAASLEEEPQSSRRRELCYPSNHFFLSWAISSATLELGPTGSIKTMCLAFRTIRSGACHSLPRRIRMFFTSLVS